jgi:predicted NUDIX family NTP pyrophosphohydrolase
VPDLSEQVRGGNRAATRIEQINKGVKKGRPAAVKRRQTNLARRSAGLLVFRRVSTGIEVLAVHPGGPFWARKDDGAWSIPKGEIEQTTEEEPYVAARREFQEELGQPPPDGESIDLGMVRQGGGKVVHAWAIDVGETAIETTAIKSNLVEFEWPRGTGRMKSFPEVDKAEWMSPEKARLKLNKSQATFVDRLLHALND